jgi:hypothetical protein
LRRDFSTTVTVTPAFDVRDQRPGHVVVAEVRCRVIAQGRGTQDAMEIADETDLRCISAGGPPWIGGGCDSAAGRHLGGGGKASLAASFSVCGRPHCRGTFSFGERFPALFCNLYPRDRPLSAADVGDGPLHLGKLQGENHVLAERPRRMPSGCRASTSSARRCSSLSFVIGAGSSFSDRLPSVYSDLYHERLQTAGWSQWCARRAGNVRAARSGRSGVLPQFIDQHPRILAVIYGDRDELHAALLKSPLERRHQPLGVLDPGTARVMSARETKSGFPNVMPKSVNPSVACFQRIMP